MVACDAEPSAVGPPPGERALSAARSPYRGTLVFQSDRDGNWELYTIEAEGSGLTRLTRHPADDQNPAWSPDGRQIVFSSQRSGNGDLYLLDVEKSGSAARQLTDHPGYEGAPRFSPDGRSVVFEGERDGGRAQIYRLDLASGDVARVTETRSRKLGPAYSPDGSELAYMEKGLLWWQVTVLDWKSGETSVASRGGGSCRPSWSPDGSYLAYVSTTDTPKADVWLRELRGARAGEAWRVSTRPDAHNYDPSFSPDGLALAIASTRERGGDEQWDLFVVDLNGRHPVRLTGEEGNERFPDWRPAAGSE